MKVTAATISLDPHPAGDLRDNHKTQVVIDRSSGDKAQHSLRVYATGTVLLTIEESRSFARWILANTEES